jgi:peptide/nickel transport system permease protein
MARYLRRRILHALIVLWAAFTLSFLILFIVPGDPVITMLGPDAAAEATPEQLAALRASLGTDQPLWVQYLNQLWHVVTGDLGESFRTGIPVSAMLGQALPSTLALASASLTVGILIGVAIALAANFTRAAWLRSLLLALPPIAVSMPTFWIGLMLLQFFSFRLGWFPAIGGQGIQALILPTITLAIPVSAIIAQVLSKSLESTLAEPYAEVITAKGASRRRLFFGHALRNAAVPAMTVAGVLVATVFGGSVLVETVFSRNGLGLMAATAVANKDIPVVQGVVLIAAAVFVAMSLIIDLLYPVVDPRIRLKAVTS